MIKQTRALSLLLSLVIVLAIGCHEQGPPADKTAPIQTVTVAAAADLKFALDEIIAAFRAAHPAIHAQVTYGSSGVFYSQLVQHAPFDLYFSADLLYPNRLIELGLADPDSKFVYAVGRIVVWVPAASAIDPAKLGAQSLRHESVRKIAIANPEHAPYGRAAVAALQKLGLYESVKDRLVYAENVAQTAQVIESGAADIGIIALSLAVAPALKDKGRYWEIPLAAYPRIEQGGVILSWARHPNAVRELRDYVMAPAGKAVLRRYGFSPPGE